jgi:hypothetical protein
MKKARLGLLLSIALCFGAAGVAAAEDTTVKGQLRDSFCWNVAGAQGPSHRACAIACAKKGIPVTLVEDGTNKPYVLLPPKDKQGLPESVISRMEGEASITGTVYTKGGVSYLRVKSVQ